MDDVVLPLAGAILSGAFAFAVSGRRESFLFGALAIALFLYVGDRTLRQQDEASPRYVLSSASDRSGGRWFKLKAEEESDQRPIECSCTVTSFSGELRWRLSEHALMQREDAWDHGEIIMKWPDDFRGRQVPPPGRYEIECSALTIDDDESVVHIPPVYLEFDHD